MAEPPPFVSRGGIKLRNALDAFGVDPAGRRALDVGASTGGFMRLPAPGRGRCGDRARRGLRRARLAATHGRARDGDRTPQRALASAGRPALRARSDRGRRVLHLAAQGPAGRARLRRAARSTASRWSSPSSRSGGARVGKGGVVRSADDRRAALVAVGEHARDELGASVLGYASSGLPGPAGNRESFVWLAEAGRAGRGRGSGSGGAEGRALSRPGERDHRLHAPAQGGREGAARAPARPRARERGGGPPAQRGGGEARDRAARRAWCSAPTPTARPTWRWPSAATGRSSPACAASPAATCPCSRSTTARSASSPRWSPRSSRRAFGARWPGSST